MVIKSKKDKKKKKAFMDQINSAKAKNDYIYTLIKTPY